MIVLDADTLGRHRTGDETYVRELLRALPRDLDLAAVTRRTDLVPDGVRAIELQSRVQELTEELAQVRAGQRRDVAVVPKSTALVVWQPRRRR